jgi:hypothetical protein
MTTTLTAIQAQALLPDLTVEQVRQLLQKTGRAGPRFTTFDVKVRYLGHLCARGDTAKIKSFLDEIDSEEVEKIVNATPYDQWNGTCLYMVSCWNTGEKAHQLFELLLGYGAKFLQNTYGEFPWECHAGLWLSPISHLELGKRNVEEFKETMEQLYHKYNCRVSNPPVFP